MLVKLLTEHHLEELSFKAAHLSLHIPKCHIVDNLMHWLIFQISCIIYWLIPPVLAGSFNPDPFGNHILITS